jgi:hypothetical protein
MQPVRNVNLLPHVVIFDSESNTSTLHDRLFRPIVTLPGRWPKCDRSQAVAVDGPPTYNAKPCYKFYDGQINSPRCDPLVRNRLRALV